MNREGSSIRALWTVFIAALKLGVTSFGGPSAHIGYFREEYVSRRKWLSDEAFAELNALCQFLPGPSSSQLGMAIGAKRAGTLGAIAAWVGFTFPSVLLMILFAYSAQALSIADAGWLQGLKLAAVAIVAQAVWSMAKTLAVGPIRASLAIGSAAVAILISGMWGQILPLIISACFGLMLLKPHAEPALTTSPDDKLPISRRAGISMLVTFVTLLVLLPAASQWTGSPLIAFIDSFYRAGSLVFGGGHVVLPMLEVEFLNKEHLGLTSEQLLAGYGAVQAVPGPLFTFAAYIGAAVQTGSARIVYAGIAIVSIFLPAFLLIMGSLPFWEALKRNNKVRSALNGINAGIVGILLAALYDPIFVDTVVTSLHLVIALALFALLHYWKRPPWQIVILSALAGQLLL